MVIKSFVDIAVMSKIFTIKAIIILATVFSLPAAAQPVGEIAHKSQEVSEIDGIPVLIKHLPAWEGVREQTVFAKSVQELRAPLGPRPILDLIDFSAGTEAVTANYQGGKLLIIEYSTPQGSVDADGKFQAFLAESGDLVTVYRRIGNYNAFVFDTPDPSAANALLDEVKYEKDIQWLGDNPFLITAERAFVLTTSDIFLSTVLVILIGIGVAIVGGVIGGFVYFQFRDARRAKIHAFSDAGGMTRLNLDGFTADDLG